MGAEDRVMTSVSVVIPCYRYGNFLEECAASVLDDQPGVDVRVLIIDDASPDDSAEIARKIAARDSRVEVVVHPTNKGNIATFNEGVIDWADGDYCMLLSADDRLTPRALRRAADLFDANPTVGFVYGRALWCIDGTPPPTARTTTRGWSVWRGDWWLERRFRQAENPIVSPETVMRTSVLKRVGGFDPRLPKAADMELFMRLAANADVGFLRGADQAYYRVHGKNMSSTVSVLMDLRERRSVFEIVLDRERNALSDRGRLSDMVHRQLSRQALWAAACVYDRQPRLHSGLARRLLGTQTDHDDRDVDALVAFAVDCWPEISRLSLYRTLQSRQGVGPRAMAYMLNQKGQWWLRRRAWKYRGF
jgi:glycosyltransferase involved in cell wall biosynthesis